MKSIRHRPAVVAAAARVRSEIHPCDVIVIETLTVNVIVDD